MILKYLHKNRKTKIKKSLNKISIKEIKTI